MFTSKSWLISALILVSGCAVHKPNTQYAAPQVYALNSTYDARDKDNAQQLRQQYAKWAGTPYHYGGNSKRGIDCSAFMMRLFEESFRKPLPRTTAQQVKLGALVSKQRLKVGDLVFFRTSRKQRHVGVFVGQDTFIHASVSKGVTTSKLTNPYWHARYWQSRRIL